ncbi:MULTISPECIES: hypothetical protein [unclassified Bradyrhizobium]
MRFPSISVVPLPINPTLPLLPSLPTINLPTINLPSFAAFPDLPIFGVGI